MDFNKYIRGNVLYAHDVTVDIKELVSFLQNKTRITKLSLRNCKIGEKGAEALANGNLSHLTSLDLHSNNIGEKGAEALAKLSHLTSLDLNCNKIGEKGAEALANGNLSHLTSLDLNCNKIGEKGAEALAKLSHLTSLDLSLNDIGEKGAEALANGNLSHLTSLDLNCNKIGEKGAEALANGNLSHLTSLDLGSNNIGEKGAEALANGNLSHLTSLDLHSNNIGEKGAEALANGNLSHLTSLELYKSNIGEKGAEALANGNLSHLTSLNLHSNNIGAEGIEALAKLQHRGVFLVGAEEIFYNFLSGVYSNKNTMNEENLKKVVFEVAQIGNDVYTIQSILTHPDEYRFLINSRDERGHTLSHFYTHSPEMQKFLFERGLIPEKEVERDAELQNVLQDNQSVHASSAVKKTNFIAKKLVEYIKANGNQLYQEVNSYVEGIPKLLEEYQNNQVKVGLLSLAKDEKKSVMKKTLGDNPVPNDKEFIKIVIDKAKDVLEKKYLKKNQRGEFNQGYPTHRIQYDYARDDAKVTIPESIGYVKLLIDRFSIPLRERKELLVTFAQQNPRLVTEKLLQIRSELGDDNISEKQITDRTKFHKLLKNVDPNKVNKLFKEMSGFDIEKTWREQKEFILLRQIYIAATTYGEDISACIQGTWTQIIDSIKEISSEIMAQYDRHLKEEQKQEMQKNFITEENIKPFMEGLANKLIQHVALHPELKETLEDFVMCIVDIDKPEEITFEQQKVLAEINEYFNRNIKGVLQNYDRNIPSKGEYSFIIEGLSEVVQLQELFKLQENITGEMEAQIDEDSSDEWFDVEDNSNSYVTSSESDTDEEFKDASESISPEESNVLLVSERSQPENSVRALATDQKMVKYLMEKGDYFHEKKADKWTLLHLAAEDGSLEIVEFLLENGAKVDEKDANGLAPLHLAALNGHTEIVKALIGKGAKVDAANKDGCTPSHWATLNVYTGNGKLDTVKYLVEKGANVLIKNTGGQIPRDLAKDKNIIQLLKEAETKQITSAVIKTGVTLGITTALTIGVGCGIAGVGLSILVIAGIAASAALVVGLAAGGITYQALKPSDKLDKHDLEANQQVPQRA